MNIADIIYQHVKTMPINQALEVLQFITVIETKTDTSKTEQPTDDILEFIKNLPVHRKRSDLEIHQAFQTLRDEWV
jgi:hypothetical protein